MSQTKFGRNSGWLRAGGDAEQLLPAQPGAERARAEDDERSSTSCTSVRRLEYCSAVWSGVVLAFMLGLLVFSPRIRGVELPLWWSVTQLAVDSAQMNSSIAAYHGAWTALCTEHNAFPVNSTQTFPGEDDTPVAARVFVGTEQWGTGFYPLGMLIWIFAVSVVFQGARAAPRDGALAGVAAYFGYEVTAAIEFSRWLEYALTSPLQLWLVLASFFVGDFATLLYAALGQAGLVLLGGLVEHYVGRAAACEHCALALLVLTWLVHALLWLPVLLSFYRIDKHFTDCGADAEAVKRWREVRGIIYFILYSQLVTFSLFGVRLTLTALERAATRAAVFAARVRDARWYALLSVSAKSALDAGFVLLLFRLSTPEPAA
jgi:hypothetical protein